MKAIDWDELFQENPFQKECEASVAISMTDLSIKVEENDSVLTVMDSLSRAAEEGQEEEFDRLLEQAEGISIWRELRQGEVYGDMFRTVFVLSMLISKKKYYLDKIFRRYGLQNEVFEWRHCYIKRMIYTDAPRIYTAVLSGSVDLVKMYLDYGAVLEKDGTADCLMQKVDYWPVNAVYDSRIKWEIPAEYRREEGYHVRFDQKRKPGKEGDKCRLISCFGTALSDEADLSFHDSFTAAILSQNKEMIRFVADRLGEIAWNGCMEHSIVCSGLEITEWLIETFPEMLNYISLRKIMEGKNVVLLRHFLEKRTADLHQQWEEWKEFLHWYTEKAYRDQKRQCYWKRQRTREELKFYREMFSCAPDEECRNLLTRMVLLEWIQAKIEGYGGQKSLLKLFYSQHRDERQEYMKVLFHFFHFQWKDLKEYIDLGIYFGMGVESCLEHLNPISCEKEYRRLGVDLYDEEIEEWGKEYKDYRRTGRLFMKIFVPVRVEHKTDWFTRGVVKYGDVGLIKSAVRRGFITGKNADCLYLYAADLKKPKEEVMEILIRLSQEMDLKKRYEELS